VLALAPAAFAYAPGNSWRMDLSGGVVQDANGTQPMSFTGQGVLSTTGLVGGAVEFTRAPSFGTVANSKNDNPGNQNFAMGLVFTTQPIPSTNYGGNLMQKGLFGDAGQVKLQLAPTYGGTVNCRIKGTSGAKIITSTVNVDDGAWHTAVCWRAGNVVGVTVDSIVKSLTWNPGSITNGRNVLLGNKGINADATDQHFGRTDFATWVIDPNARAIVEQQVLASG
jgi:hypothetical protein